MRTIFNTIIIIFVITSLYIMRDDIKVLYDRFFGGDKAEQVSDSPNTNSIDTEETLNGTVLGLKKIIETPGALRVADAISNVTGKSELTQSGVIEGTNTERANAGLGILKENIKLDLSAEKKVEDMFKYQYFEHISPSGMGVSDLGDSVAYEYILIGENLALGNFKDDKAVLAAWMASPGHRANILNKNYTEIGVSVKKGMFEGKEVWLAVQHFGTPKDVCPSIDLTLKASIQANQDRLKTMQADLAKKLKDANSGEVVDGKTHDEQVTIYNELVSEYNKLVAKTKRSIDTYNKEVREFNTCVESKQ